MNKLDEKIRDLIIHASDERKEKKHGGTQWFIILEAMDLPVNQIKLAVLSEIDKKFMDIKDYSYHHLANSDGTSYRLGFNRALDDIRKLLGGDE